jgi:hypothetical protein
MLNGIAVGTDTNVYSNNALNNGDVVNCLMTDLALGFAIDAAVPVTMNVMPTVTPSVVINASAGSIVPADEPGITFTATPINGGTTPAYQWMINGTEIACATTEIYTAGALADGDVINCSLTSNATCATVADVTSNTLDVTHALNIAAVWGLRGYINAYPNPNNGIFSVTGNTGNSLSGALGYTLTDMLGNIVCQDKLIVNNGHLDGLINTQNRLPAGLYILVLDLQGRQYGTQIAIVK